MAKTIHINDAPQRLLELWRWIIAIDSWEYGDPQPLSTLIKDQSIPEEFKKPVAEIIDGTRKVNRKAMAKLKIPASERMNVAWHIDVSLGLLSTFKHSTVEKESFCEHIGNRDGKEASEVLYEIDMRYRDIIENAAQELNVSVETVKNLLRDMRKYIKNWPIV